MVPVLHLAAESPPAARGFHWGDDGLMLDLPEGRGSARPECRCGRSHWLLVTRATGPDELLQLRCHGCGSRWEIPLLGSRRR